MVMENEGNEEEEESQCDDATRTSSRCTELCDNLKSVVTHLAGVKAQVSDVQLGLQ